MTRVFIALLFSLLSPTIAMAQTSPCYWSGSFTKCYPTSGIYLDKQRALQLGDSGSNSVNIAAPSTISSSYSIVMPSTGSSTGQVMVDTGGGVMGWETPATTSAITDAKVNIIAKPAADLASTTNIASLSGEQTIDGTMTFATPVLLKNQTDNTQNGLWITSSGPWTRSGYMPDNTASALSAIIGIDGINGGTNTKTLWYSQADFTGAVPFVQIPTTGSNTPLAASKALTTNASGQVAASATTATELGYVSGVTSALQTQLNAKQSTTLTSAHLLVGNGSNVATDTAVTGDVTITNAGVTAIGSGKVTSGMILDGTIVDADINASAAIAGSKLVAASSSVAGAVTAGTQTMAGAKTWNDVQTWKYSSGATTAGSYDTNGTWTLGASGGSQVHVMNGGLDLLTLPNFSYKSTYGFRLSSQNGTGGSAALMQMHSTASDFGSIILGTVGSDSGTAPALLLDGRLGGGGALSTRPVINFGSQGTVYGALAAGGAWQFGTTAMTNVSHGFVGANTSTDLVVFRNSDTTSSSNGFAPVNIRKGSTQNDSAQIFVHFNINNGSTDSGYITANNANQATFTSSSDRRLKKNIVDIPPQLENIKAMRPVEFEYKDGSGHQTGFIAQEVQDIYPETVAPRPDGYLMLAGWGKTEARLVKAIQELSAQQDALKKEFAAYKAEHP